VEVKIVNLRLTKKKLIEEKTKGTKRKSYGIFGKKITAGGNSS
jgi:hypothetical protein